MLAPVQELPALLRRSVKGFQNQHEKPPCGGRTQPRKAIRADKAPTTGYSLVVDGHSNHITKRSSRRRGGIALKNKFQMLQVRSDAENKTRSMIDWPGPAYAADI